MINWHKMICHPQVLLVMTYDMANYRGVVKKFHISNNGNYQIFFPSYFRNSFVKQFSASYHSQFYYIYTILKSENNLDEK